MSGKSIHGIDGVLDGLISTASKKPMRAGTITRPAKKPFKRESSAEQPRNNHSDNVQGARRGRPLGRHDGLRSPKDKVTLRISSNLATEYRDWSWEARCSLSSLVERALVDYRRNRR